VKHNRRHRIQELVAFLSREHAQTMPDNAFTLSVISGSSVLALTRFSDSAANAITGLVRLFF
jgi:hypothetical protein